MPAVTDQKSTVINDGLRDAPVPQRGPDVPAKARNPRSTCADSAANDVQALTPAQMFRDHLRSFEASAPSDVVTTGPFA